MVWCLVSDASEPTLRELRALIQSHPPATSEPVPSSGF
jgi:hypothetical protein